MTPRHFVVPLLGCVIVLGVGAAAFHYSKRYFKRTDVGNVFNRAHTQERALALTFDDGPREPDTLALLDVLDREHVRATFFMVGQAIERHPELAKEVVRRGHEVGNHSYSHARMPLMSAAFCREEITRTDALLRQVGASGPIHFRAPFGDQSGVLTSVLDEMHRLDVLSSVVTRDYDRPGTERIVADVIHQIQPGAVVALHDGGGPRDQTVSAVQQLIPALRAQGYRFLTVNELLALEGR